MLSSRNELNKLNSSLLIFHFLSNRLNELVVQIFVDLRESKVGASLAGERNKVFGTFFSLVELNGDLGGSKHDGLNILLHRFLLCLLIWILLNFFYLVRLLLHEVADKLHFPGLIRDGDMLVLGLNELVEDWHNVEGSGIDNELRGLCSHLLDNFFFEVVVHLEIHIKSVALAGIGSTSAV